MGNEDGLSLQSVVRRLLSDECDIALSAPSLSGKRVLLRADLNVPLTDDGAILDDTRISAMMPTLTLLLEAGAKVTSLHTGN